MKKNKPISLVVITLLVLSALTIAYTPAVKSGPFTGTDQNFYGTIEPQVISGAYPYPVVRFQFNITSNVTSPSFINKTVITLPTGWEYVSAENSTEWNVTSVAGTPPTVTYENRTAEAALEQNQWALFNITAKAMTSGSARWTIACYEGTTSHGSATVDVEVTPWFDAVITPDLKAAGKTLWFEIKVTNNASESSINKVEITHPSTEGWTLLDYTGPTGWTYTYDGTTHKVTFTAPSGSEIVKGSYAVFKFKMTTGTPSPSNTESYDWPITCTNTLGVTATMTPKVTIDNTKPTITVDAPTVDWYSVGSGNYMWLNITVHDDVNKLPSVVLNDTRFTLHAAPTVSGTYDFKYCYRNNTAIPDGPLAINVTASDYVGNAAIPKVAQTTVDNTPPFIWIDIGPDATKVGSTYWIGKTLGSIWINVTVASYELEPIGPLTGIYINGTRQSWTFSSTGKNYSGYPIVESNNTYTLDPDAKYWIVYVNATDKATPSNHTSQMTVYIERDYVPPYEIGFTSAKPICGGLVVYGLYAEDLVGVYDYVFEVNGTDLTTILQTALDSTVWTGNAFSGVIVLDLTSHAGENVNITVYARDYGANKGNETVVYTGAIPEGEWSAVVLQPKWNLISLPLIPVSSARADILSLVLKQGATGVVVTYGYNQTIDDWDTNPAKMTDGWGYWLYVLEYDVLIVQGTVTPTPPATPRTYLFTEGWVLAGFKSTSDKTIAAYIASLEPASYFPYVYVWDAEKQNWNMLHTTEDLLKVGQGFWIWMYEDQYLIPPI